MTTVYVIGQSSDNCLEKLILSQLTRTYRVTYVKNKSLVQEGIGYNVLVADFTELKSLYVPECIIVLKNGGLVPQISLPKKCMFVANSEETNKLAGYSNVITCGVSSRDTLCCSSMTEKSVVVSLNREITAFSGRKIRPLEVPLKLDPAVAVKDVYYPMAFTALRLLLDDFNSELGSLI